MCLLDEAGGDGIIFSVGLHFDDIRPAGKQVDVVVFESYVGIRRVKHHIACQLAGRGTEVLLAVCSENFGLDARIPGQIHLLGGCKVAGLLIPERVAVGEAEHCHHLFFVFPLQEAFQVNRADKPGGVGFLAELAADLVQQFAVEIQQFDGVIAFYRFQQIVDHPQFQRLSVTLGAKITVLQASLEAYCAAFQLW